MHTQPHGRLTAIHWNGCECERDGTRIRMSKYDKRKTSSHMHTNWDQCPQKAITVSLCDYLRHYTVLYWTMAVWTHTYNRISAESMTKCKRRSLQKREDQVRFQNRKSNCAIFVILAFKSIECFLAFAFRISFYRSFCILAVRIGVAMICKMYTVLPFTLIISSHYLNMFLFFLSLSILAVSVSVLYVFPLFFLDAFVSIRSITK